MLRAYKAGKPLPKALGHIHLFNLLGMAVPGWPSSGRRCDYSLQHCHAMNIKTTTDGLGRFSLQDAPPGEYRVRVDPAPYHMDPEAIQFGLTNSVNGYLRVPEAGRGYTEVQLATATSLDGIVLDPGGKGDPKIPVSARMKDGSPRTHGLFAVTGRDGRLTMSGVPDTNVYISAGVDSEILSGGTNLGLDMRYRAVYYPGGSTAEAASPLRLKLGEKRSILLRLGSPLQWTRVDVKVVNKDRRSKVGANVDLYGGPPGPEGITSGAGGLGSLQCLTGWKYELDAAAFGEHRRPDGKREVLVASREPLICGDRKTPIVLVLDHTPRGIVAGQMVDNRGVALEYPRVRMYGDAETIPRYEARGDGTGRFRIEEVDPGVYTIHIAVQGVGEKIFSRIGVDAGQITDLGAIVWTFR